MIKNETMGQAMLLVGGLDATAAALGAALEAQGSRVNYAGDAEDTTLFAAPFATVSLDDPAALAAQVAALDPFDTALVLPGWRELGAFLDTTAEEWDAAVTRNYERAIYATQACARQLIARGQGGRLIYVTSVLALMPFAGASALGTTLAAVHALARMAAVDFAQHGITANVVAPGWLAGAEFQALPEATQAHIRAGIPLARPGSADEVAGAVRFLASAAGGYITGAVLPADGGYTLTRSDGRTLLRP